ncbi:Peptidase_C39 like family protein [Caprobacter fermentans]|uniref:Peptidase_C39 like family protein n=1 Tax=Caproicibacter fermentans TaxID=2576756 RepID=A0A6N8HW21_9FIRM|nr:C39 family peptidase [Caproicibacter fermentans]MVB09868.1 Peptidase_C39 like family protein [Caproicibacter fermentans]OCN00347.1 hypothetical protein A7X67_09850 [Clostridium sp. W14A]
MSRRRIGLFSACLLIPAVALVPAAGCGQNALHVTADAVETSAEWEEEMILPVENIQQMPEQPSGCEITSTTIVLNYIGCEITKTELADYFQIGGLPRRSGGVVVGPDPWKKFAGSPAENGYGCFAPVVTQAANRYFSSEGLSRRAVNLSGTKAGDLFDYIDRGIPVIVWATISMKEPYEGDGWYLEGTKEYFRWPAREHCLVLIGHSGNDAVFSDPLDPRGTVRYDFSLFEARYRQLFCQAVVLE